MKWVSQHKGGWGLFRKTRGQVLLTGRKGGGSGWHPSSKAKDTVALSPVVEKVTNSAFSSPQTHLSNYQGKTPTPISNSGSLNNWNQCQTRRKWGSILFWFVRKSTGGAESRKLTEMWTKFFGKSSRLVLFIVLWEYFLTQLNPYSLLNGYFKQEKWSELIYKSFKMLGSKKPHIYFLFLNIDFKIQILGLS